MEHRDYITLEETARLQGAAYQTVKKRLQRARVTMHNDPADARRKLVRVSEALEKGILSRAGYEAWLREQAAGIGPSGHGAIEPSGDRMIGRSEDHATISPAAGSLPEKALNQSDSSIVPTSPAPPQISQSPDEPMARSLARLQPSLPFLPPSASQAARDAVVAAIPGAQRNYVDRWLAIIADNVNGTWKRFRGTVYGDVMVGNRDDFMRGQAHLYDVSKSSIYAKIKVAQSILGAAEVPKQKKWMRIAESLVPRLRPGRSGHSFFTDPENAWMWPELRRIYLNQARHSMRAARDILIEVIKKKQEAWGIGHLYQIPTPAQVRTALNGISKAELVLAREGAKAFNDQCAPYISRDYSTLKSNDLWVTDQRLVNVRLRGAGERLGRVWLVNFLDVASFKWLGFWFAPVLSSEVVMMAAATALERWGVPGAVHIDCGKEFWNSKFSDQASRGFKVRGETLFSEALGLWDRLGVRIVKAIGRNPQTKTIERWHHVVDDFDKRFPGWCGSNPDERPEKLKDEEAEHAAWLEGKAERSPLATIEQYVRAFADWAEGKWNARHRGRGKILQGSTPNEAFNAKRPAKGFRTITPEQVAYETSDRRKGTVQRGGQVNLRFWGQEIEYVAEELFGHIGDPVEVIRSRRSLRQVTVIYPVTGGTASCVAHAKPQFHWLSDDPEERDLMRQAMRCKAAMRRAVKRGIEASHKTLEAGSPVELLPEGTREISSVQYMAEKLGLEKRRSENRPTPRRRMTSSELARAAHEAQEEA
jgi:hypothetical protein